MLRTNDQGRQADVRHNLDYRARNVSREIGARPDRGPQRTGILALSSGLLAAALCTLASDSLFRYAELWPWWAALAISCAGFSVALPGASRDWASGLILIINLAWAAVYSLILIQYRYTNAPSGIQHLELLCWICTALDIFVLFMLIFPFLRTSNSISSKLQILLLIYMAVGIGLTATAFQSSSYSLELFDFAGWALFVAALVNLVNSIALLRAPTRARSRH